MRLSLTCFLVGVCVLTTQVVAVQTEADSETLVSPGNRRLAGVLNLTEHQMRLRDSLINEKVERLLQAIAAGNNDSATALEIEADIARQYMDILTVEQLVIADQYSRFTSLIRAGHSANSLQKLELEQFLDLSEDQQEQISRIVSDLKNELADLRDSFEEDLMSEHESLIVGCMDEFLPHQKDLFDEYFGELLDASGKAYAGLDGRMTSMVRHFTERDASVSLQLDRLEPVLVLVWSNGLDAPIRLAPLVEILLHEPCTTELDLSAEQVGELKKLQAKIRNQYKDIGIYVSSGTSVEDRSATALRQEALRLTIQEIDGQDSSRAEAVLEFSEQEEQEVSDLLGLIGKAKTARAKQLYRQYRSAMLAPSGIIYLDPELHRLLELTDRQLRAIQRCRIEFANKIAELRAEYQKDVKQAKLDAYADSLDVLTEAQLAKLKHQVGRFLYPDFDGR